MQLQGRVGKQIQYGRDEEHEYADCITVSSYKNHLSYLKVIGQWYKLQSLSSRTRTQVNKHSVPVYGLLSEQPRTKI